MPRLITPIDNLAGAKRELGNLNLVIFESTKQANNLERLVQDKEKALKQLQEMLLAEKLDADKNKAKVIEELRAQVKDFESIKANLLAEIQKLVGERDTVKANVDKLNMEFNDNLMQRAALLQREEKVRRNWSYISDLAKKLGVTANLEQ